MKLICFNIYVAVKINNVAEIKDKESKNGYNVA